MKKKTTSPLIEYLSLKIVALKYDTELKIHMSGFMRLYAAAIARSDTDDEIRAFVIDYSKVIKKDNLILGSTGEIKEWLDKNKGVAKKPCSQCGGIKPIESFGLNPNGWMGISTFCSVCITGDIAKPTGDDKGVNTSGSVLATLPEPIMSSKRKLPSLQNDRERIIKEHIYNGFIPGYYKDLMIPVYKDYTATKLDKKGNVVEIYSDIHEAVEDTKGATARGICSVISGSVDTCAGYNWEVNVPPLVYPTILKLDLKGKVLSRYKSVTDASIANNIPFEDIRACVTYTKRSAYGYLWLYTEHYAKRNNKTPTSMF